MTHNLLLIARLALDLAPCTCLLLIARLAGDLAINLLV
jgi:hypothetical protein